MTIIDRYIVRAILGTTALVMAVLLALTIALFFIEEQHDVGQGNYTAASALVFVLMNLPQRAWELLPIGALIGALLGLGSLARGSELTVLRSSGMAVTRIAGSALIAGLILLAVEVILGELLAPQLAEAAKHLKAAERFADVSFGGGGAWVRDGNLMLNVEQRAGSGQFGSMLVFELSPRHELNAIGRAARTASGGQSRWLLSGYAESRFTPERVLASSDGQRTLDLALSAGFLALAMSDPQQLHARALWSLIQYDRTNALDPRPYLFAFWSRIARTLAIAFAVMLPIPFVLGALRSAGTGARMAVGMLLGLGFFMLQRLIEPGTVVFDLNPVMLAWIPTALLAVLTLGLLARVR